MSHEHSKKKAATRRTDSIQPIQPAEPAAEVPRSGAGAGTALSAMLKKRQMRATQDIESEAQLPPPKAENE